MNKPSLPVGCPSCGNRLQVTQLDCSSCSTSVSGHFPLPDLATLEGEDREFVLQFVLASGSLKEVARKYGVSYPTVRNRLDYIIDKLKETQNEGEPG